MYKFVFEAVHKVRSDHLFVKSPYKGIKKFSHIIQYA